MSYASVDDVKALMAHFKLGAASNPTQEQATLVIAMIASEMDGAAHSYTDVPITTPEYFVDYLSTVNAWGATASILKSMFPATTGQGENPAWSFWERKYQAALKSLKDGTGLPDEIKISTNRLQPSTYFTKYPTDEHYVDYYSEPYFRRRMPF